MSMSAHDEPEVTGTVGTDGITENYVDEQFDDLDEQFDDLDERSSADPIREWIGKSLERYVVNKIPGPFTDPSYNTTVVG